MKKQAIKIFVLGISGSIGKKVLQRIAHLNALHKEGIKESKKNNFIPPNCFSVVGIAVRSSYKAAVKAASLYPTCTVVVTSQVAYKKAQAQLAKTNFKGKLFSCIEKALKETKYKVLVNALVGGVGLKPTYMALIKNKKVLLANKESLVMGGELFKKKFSAGQLSSLLVPIDSEHSAIQHLLHLSAKNRNVVKLILTASGGPFFGGKEKNPSIQQALAHPNWRMGKKISIDSATMMNKGLEVIEAHYLFNFSYKQIEVLIHPQSILHSLIETEDGEQYAQIGSAEMGYAIQNALTYPALCKTHYKPFSLTSVNQLTFFLPNTKKFPLLKLAYKVGSAGKTFPAVMNAANEKAVALFLKGKIPFKNISKAVHWAVEKHKPFNVSSIENLIMLDEEIKKKVEQQFK